MLKRVDVAVFTFVEDVAKGRFKAGVTKFDLAADGVGYTTSGGKITALKPQLDDLKKQIAEGKIKVPTVP